MAARIAPFVPTPLHCSTAALRLADVGRGDVFMDLGSGDGRVVISAAKDHGCDAAIGIEIDADLVAQARNSARGAGLDHAWFACGSILDANAVLCADLSPPSLPPLCSEPPRDDTGFRKPLSRRERAVQAGSAAEAPSGTSPGSAGMHAGLTSSSAVDVARSRFGDRAPQLQDVTVCYLFMGDWSSDDLLPTLHSTLQPGTRVISVGYPLYASNGRKVPSQEQWQVVDSTQVMDLEVFLYQVK